MSRLRLLSLPGALLLLSVSALQAQAVDPSGHWVGAIHAPFGDVAIEVDLATDNGKPVGTFSNPGEQLRGLPIWSVAIEGPSTTMQIRVATSAFTLKGRLSADGRSMSGDFLQSVYSVPFSLTRTGDATIEPAPRSAAIDRTLEGEWSGTLNLESGPLDITVIMTNHADGTATGTWAGNQGVHIPIVIAQQPGVLTLSSKVSPSRFSGTVNADGTEIAGTFTEKQLTLPLTFRRVNTAAR